VVAYLSMSTCLPARRAAAVATSHAARSPRSSWLTTSQRPPDMACIRAAAVLLPAPWGPTCVLRAPRLREPRCISGTRAHGMPGCEASAYQHHHVVWT
jgi:hypothetical protein